MDTAAQHVENSSKAQNVNSLKTKIDNRILPLLSGLISTNPADRVNKAAALLNILAKNEGEDNEYQRNYILKRLVRGCGASTANSRTAFFTTLVGFLKVVDDVNTENVFDVCQAELTVKSGEDKVDPHANTGRILVCGALIRSGKIISSSDKNISKCTEMLVKAAKVKKFQYSLSFSFLTELIKKLKKGQIKHLIWAHLETELTKPWPKQNRDTIYLFFALEDAHPTIANKLLASTCVGSGGVLSSANAGHVTDILWSGTSMMTINHPVYDVFAQKLANSPIFSKIWQKINKQLENVSKINEIITTRVLNGVFSLTTKLPSELSMVLTPNLMKMIVARFSNVKQKNSEIFIEFYKELFKNINAWLKRLPEEEPRLEFIKKLIFHPGQLTFDRLTSSDLVNSTVMTFSTSELKEFTEILRSISIGAIEKGDGEKWLNTEKYFATQSIAKLLSLKSVATEVEWKKSQLTFLFNLSFLKTTNGAKLTTDADKDIGSASYKVLFYRGLDLKYGSLEEERSVILDIVTHINGVLNQKHGMQSLKSPLSEKGHRAWNEMFATVNAAGKKVAKNNLQLVINIILLHMGLQLFNDETLAISAIDELRSCVDRITKKKSDDEPEWIEVVVDLFLHLLSYNSNLLRNVVVKVFPSLCPLMTISSVHQILSVLDMAEGYNPLTDVGGPDDESDVEENGDAESSSDEDDGDDDEDDDDGNSEDNSLMDDEGTVTDQLRNAVTQALGKAVVETDNESLDLDDMDDDEAARLDNALSQAFKAYSENRRSKKPTKKERIAQTSAIHFRVRVLDLVEIYIKTDPKMSYLLEILIALFDILNHTAKDGGPVLLRTQQILNKLTVIKHIENKDDVTDDQLCEIFKNLVAKKFDTAAITKRNEYLPKSTNFIIACAELLSKDSGADSKIIEILQEHLREFITQRNPALTLDVFSAIFMQTWSGIWDLCKTIASTGLASKIRSIRSSQMLGLIKTLYRNHRLIQLKPSKSQKKLHKTEKALLAFIKTQTSDTTLTQKVFSELLDLLMEINRCYKKITELSPQIDWDDVKEDIQTIRKKLQLDTALNNYRKFCHFIGGMEIFENAPKQNGVHSHESGDEEDEANNKSSDEEDSEKSPAATNGTETNKKRKKRSKNKIKTKKLKTGMRMKVSSEGMTDELSFSKLSNDAEVLEDDDVTMATTPKQKHVKSKKKFKKQKIN